MSTRHPGIVIVDDPNNNHDGQDLYVTTSSLNLDTDDSMSNVRNVPSTSPSSAFFSQASHTHVDRSVFTYVHGNQLNVNSASDPKEILATLKPVSFRVDYVQQCMEGTRENILAEIEDWLKDGSAPNILRLKGSPGSGKSAIASSLVSRLMEHGRLGSKIFFKRDNITLSNPTAVWPTVAHDLAQSDTSFASILVGVLSSRKVDPIGWPDITLNFKALIERPLMQRHEHSPLDLIPVIIIDGLDECGSETSQAGKRRTFLDTLTQWSKFPSKFKLVVTGRDERLPQSLLDNCKEIELPTGAEVDRDAEGDIRHFFVQHFSGVSGTSLPSWLREDDLAALTNRAAGLFIWAETVVELVVQQKQSLPGERLKLVLEGDLGESDRVAKLYRQVLDLSFEEADNHKLGVFKQVVTAIILAKIPLHVDDLCQLISHPSVDADFIPYNNLSSVISIASDKRISIKHLSFTDFICDSRRCPQQFYIDCVKGKQEMSKTCIENAILILKSNIWGLTLSQERTCETLPGHVAYACTYWIEHVCEIREDASSISRLLETFLFRHLLHWLEIMSILNLTRTTINSLRCLLRWAEICCYCHSCWSLK